MFCKKKQKKNNKNNFLHRFFWLMFFLKKNMFFLKKTVSFFKIVEIPVPVTEREDETPIYEGEPAPEEVEPQPRRSNRARQAPDRFGKKWVYTSATSLFNEPQSVEEALSGTDKVLWEQAMEKEMNSIDASHVWDLVELPEGRTPIESKWVFKKKIGPDGSISSYKARLVVKGYSQQIGVDYDETFSPVVRFESVRT